MINENMTFPPKDSSVDNKSKDSHIIWKSTRNGGEYVWYEEIEKDAYLRERLQKKDGFKVIIDGYSYTVKLNQDDSAVVFRNKVKRITDNLESQNKTPLSSDNKPQVTHIDTHDVMTAEILKIVNAIYAAIKNGPPIHSGSTNW
ncbi:hypothetical protein [Candidatus Nitrosocosmicus sp. SS]|jgi:hypothetical protein|uniref:hypothetical protein n=1 Tax=Candidatus Nitrosocosmicus agrestis TaxID=2563600 RepID=UPI00122E76C6|nr:hypothetical protein [Candidatus Nitrosocosmicus sp. SS]KAA2279064.1 hypothetical protein F1Z66_14395 [Candidatus Nitrosocosmicus sp. SS]KAF0867647.1 hypothetical protein E5N71_14220 [Candidatus Nitrosocosmicus sp. SS]